MTVSELKQQFLSQVGVQHIQYGHDFGHSYAWIDHELAEHSFDDPSMQDEWEEFISDWLVENADLPSCCSDGCCC